MPIEATPPIPTPSRAWPALVRVPRDGRRWPGTVRAAVAVALPGLLGLALGHDPAAATATLGAFAVMYGESRPYRVRWRAVSVAACVMVVGALIGAVVGSAVHDAAASGGSALWPLALVLAMSAFVAVGAFMVDALRLGAPGAFLPLLAVEIASALPSAGVPVGHVVAWTAVGGVTAVAVAMSGCMVRPRTPERAAVASAVSAVDAFDRTRDSAPRRHAAVKAVHAAWQCLHDAGIAAQDHPLTRDLLAAQDRCVSLLHDSETALDTDGEDLWRRVPAPRPTIRFRLGRAAHLRSRSTLIVVRLLVACPAAGIVAMGLGVARPDWAVITAAMILHQGPDRVLGTYRAVHRFAGTVLGLLVLAALTPIDPTGAVLVLVLAASMAGVQAYLVRNYGLAMVFITILALLLAGLGSPDNLTGVTRDRLLETVIGVVVAVVVLWTVLPGSYRRILEDADGRVATTIERIEATRDRSEARELCRGLEFDLHSATTAALVAAHTDPEWTEQRWARHHALNESGYRVLALSGT
ncbi:FUSC family protein [Prescottella agglutinans]|uniref:MFS family permease n=1 Tax=Prescottella agglutinans TaxID=1644129 RepID=A0ABT6MB26_9NOCA|nr:FUSC family protein [Prescottella agglutinans]MDH6281001.1 MFS family permease [Prescottella agglutinans]